MDKYLGQAFSLLAPNGVDPGGKVNDWKRIMILNRKLGKVNTQKRGLALGNVAGDQRQNLIYDMIASLSM